MLTFFGTVDGEQVADLILGRTSRCPTQSPILGWSWMVQPIGIQEIRWNASDVHLIFWRGERVWDSFS